MTKNRDQGDESEPASETIPGRSLEGASYGATEREQTEDVRRRSPNADANVADGGVSEELESDSERRPD
jgi:hypothetical protein